MYKYQIIESDDYANRHLMASMHHLRWQVFHNELGWSVGLNIYNCMEFDEYDRKGAVYIVRTNPDGEVDASCRLMPTTNPYMLQDHYADFIQYEPVPQSDDVWEFSRLCSSPAARQQTGGKIMAQLITAAVEFGIVRGIKNYVSLTTDNLYPLIRRIGWEPKMLGDKRATPDDVSYSLKYDVHYDMLCRLKAKNMIDRPLLYDIEPYSTDNQEFPHDCNFYEAANNNAHATRTSLSA